MLPRPWLATSIALVLAACDPAAKAPEPTLDTDDAKVIYVLGTLIADQLDAFGLSESELPILESGMRDALLKRAKKVDPETVQPQMQAFANTRRGARAQAEKTESAAYVATMAAEPGATTAPTGYVIRTLSEGTGASPTAADTVKVHYKGTLRDGTTFDSSIERGTPAEFPVGGVIACWTQALQTMKVGGKYKVTCPSDIAYGDRGSPPAIKPGAALTFEVELIAITPAPKAE